MFYFLKGLTLSKDAEMCSRILTKLEQNSKWILQTVEENCQIILNLRHDNENIEGKGIVQVQTVWPKRKKKKKM